MGGNLGQVCYLITIKDRPATRRGVLSTVSSIYDPLRPKNRFAKSVPTKSRMGQTNSRRCPSTMAKLVERAS